VTHTEADNLIATLPKPRGLRLYREGDWIMMAGGQGSHSIAVGPSSGQRLLTHWQGYVKQQGLALKPVADVIADVSQLAREAYRALCAAKRHALMRGSLASKLRVGRWKAYSHSALSDALRELAQKGLVTSDNHGRYTAVCEG
jgi:hypothetical protein